MPPMRASEIPTPSWAWNPLGSKVRPAGSADDWLTAASGRVHILPSVRTPSTSKRIRRIRRARSAAEQSMGPFFHTAPQGTGAEKAERSAGYSASPVANSARQFATVVRPDTTLVFELHLAMVLGQRHDGN